MYVDDKMQVFGDMCILCECTLETRDIQTRDNDFHVGVILTNIDSKSILILIHRNVVVVGSSDDIPNENG